MITSEIPTTATTPYLHPNAIEAYEKYLAIRKEKKHLQARIEELVKAEAKEEYLLKTQFGEGCQFRKLPGGLLLTRRVITVPPMVVTADMIGSVTRKGYSYPDYKEIKG